MSRLNYVNALSKYLAIDKMEEISVLELVNHVELGHMLHAPNQLSGHYLKQLLCLLS